ncbi:MAG: hypothetical protein CMM52_00115 [Rhodospirillaceae bacterium]|nr:hypothetical protein [Rhodospirillaceae bacterium]|tara:strand:+ start:6167 stop:6451 length:285 start_codon:yes stop_codon:yes gene_type:complete
MPDVKKSSSIIAVTIVLTTFLIGCSNPYVERFRKEFGWTEGRMTEDGWLKSREIPPDAIYCYKTLAEPNCFKKPKPGQEHRLVSEYENAFGTKN